MAELKAVMTAPEWRFTSFRHFLYQVIADKGFAYIFLKFRDKNLSAVERFYIKNQI